jgi:hypothetical protein
MLMPALAAAQTLQDFARGIEIRTEAGSSIYRAPLPDDVYATVSRPDLGDVRVFNAAGEPVPHALREAPPPDALVEAFVTVPSFPISRTAAEGTDLAAVKIDERGTVLEVRRAPAPGETVSAYLVDVTALTAPMVALSITVEDASGSGFLARVEVRSSNDLNRWQTIVPAAAVARMRQGDYVLTQNEVALPPTRAKYFRITWPKELSAMTLASVQVRPQSATPPPEIHWTTVAGRLTSSANDAARYDAPGRFPIEQIDLEFADPTDAETVTFQSRPDDSSDWLVRYSGLFYSLSEGGDTIRNTPARVGRITDREWLLEPVGRATWRPDRLPRLKLGWRPHELLFLARGAGPYTLAYGSARVDAEDAPVDALLATLGGANPAEGAGTATLGMPRDLAGEEALNPPPPLRRLTLWAVLIVAVLALGALALGVLRDTGRSGSE